MIMIHGNVTCKSSVRGGLQQKSAQNLNMRREWKKNTEQCVTLVSFIDFFQWKESSLKTNTIHAGGQVTSFFFQFPNHKDFQLSISTTSYAKLNTKLCLPTTLQSYKTGDLPEFRDKSGSVYIQVTSVRSSQKYFSLGISVNFLKP